MDLKKILLISLGHLSCDINGGALPALLPYLAAVHHFDYQTCGTLAFAYAAMSSIVQPLFGLLSDKKPCNLYIPIGILLAGCGLGAVGFLDTYQAIFVSLMVCGVGGAIFHPEGARYANFVSGDRKGVGISIFSVGGNGGFAVGPLVVAAVVGGISLAGGGMIGGFGLRGTGFFAGLACVMAALLYWRISAWGIDKPAAVKGKGSSSALCNDWHAFSVLSVCLISRSILFLSFNTYLPLYWKNVFHQSAQTGNAVLAMFCIVGVLSNLLGGVLADRLGFVRMIRYFMASAIPFVVLFPFVQNPCLAALLMIPLSVCLYAPFSCLVVLGQRYLARNVGFASGITLGVAISVGGMFTPVVGWIADNYGGLSIAMRVLAIFSAASALAALFLKKDRD